MIEQRLQGQVLRRSLEVRHCLGRGTPFHPTGSPQAGGPRVAVEGIEEGSVVALSDPTQLNAGETGTNAAEALPGQ